MLGSLACGQGPSLLARKLAARRLAARSLVALGLLALSNLSGCADGPFAQLRTLNPRVRQEWAEDARLGPSYHDRIAGLRALGDSAHRMEPAQRAQVVSRLGELLRKEPNQLLRLEAVRALGKFPEPEASTLLVAGLRDPESDIRIVACEALGERGGDQAVAALAAVLKDEDDQDVRIAAAKQLARFPQPQSVNALAVALDDTDPALQLCAVESLRQCSGQDFGNDLQAWRQFAQSQTPQIKQQQPTVAERILNGQFVD